MNVRKRMILIIVLALFIGFGVFCIWRFLYIPMTLFKSEGEEALQRKIRLLCEIDHKSLLEACREVLIMYNRGELKQGQYRIRENHATKILNLPTVSSEKVHLPQVILDLEPTYIRIDQMRRVMVEMFGGFDHFGVMAYPEYFKEPFKGFKYGDKELIPGLWYYDDGYDETPDYGKKIDAFIEKYKKKQEK